MQFRVGIVGLAVALVLSPMFASSASARTNVDPCPGTTRVVLADGLHCGGISTLCEACVMSGRGASAPAPCNANTQEIAGVRGERTSSAVGGDWDYWTENGEWILWNGQSKEIKGARGQPIDIEPHLFNWKYSGPWTYRLFFRCVNIP